MKIAHSEGRAKSLFSSVIFGLGSRFVGLIAPMIVLPIMLRFLGSADFGVWATSISITSMGAFLDFGIGNGLLTRLSDSTAKKDFASSRRLIAGSYVILIAVAVIGVVAVSFITLCVNPFGSVSHSENGADSKGIVQAVMFIFFLGIPATVIYRILYAQRRIPLCSFLQVLGSAAAVAACLIGIHVGAEHRLVIILYGLMPILVMFLSTVWFFVTNPHIVPRFYDFKHSEAKSLIGLGSQFFILSILTAVGLNADMLIISHNAGSSAVAEFALPFRLGSVLGIVVLNLFMPLWAFNSEAFANGDVAWVRRSSIYFSFVGGLMVFIGGAVLTMLSPWIMNLWVGRQFSQQSDILWAMTISSAVISVTAPFNMVLNSKGLVMKQILAWTFFCVLTIPAKLIFVSKVTLWVAPAITAVGYTFFVTPIVIIFALRQLNSGKLGSNSPMKGKSVDRIQSKCY